MLSEQVIEVKTTISDETQLEPQVTITEQQQEIVEHVNIFHVIIYGKKKIYF